MRIFLAGAGGVLGRRLVPLLLAAGHEVTGTTRVAAKAGELAAAGVIPAIVDVFDAGALGDAVIAARPEVVIHQLTDLAGLGVPGGAGPALERNARIRTEGTRNLVAAARAARARRMIAQSIAFIYAPGGEPHGEDAPLDTATAGIRRVTVDGVIALERLVTATPGLEGVVLRYGRFYGPGSGAEAPPMPVPVHVDAAAEAAHLAVERGAPGIYNVAEEHGAVSSHKAREQLGWNPEFRL